MKALLLAPMGSVHRRFNKANIEALLELGYSVELCANFANGQGPEMLNREYVQECSLNGIVTHSIPFERHNLANCIRCLPQLKHLLKNGNYDIVHTHTETGGLLLKLASGVKRSSRFFYTPHGVSFWKGSSVKSQLVYKPLEKWICSCMDTVLGMNSEEYEIFKRWNSKSGKYLHGAGLELGRFNISDNRIRKEFGIGPDTKVVVSVGELDENKNHITAIRTIAGIKGIDFKYMICGVGPYKEKLAAEAKALGIEDKVILAGFRTDIPEILNAADIFLLPSFHEGLSVSLLEAMACGLPVLCSSIRGNRDIIEDGVNGSLFKPEDEVTLYEKMVEMLENPDLCQKMGRANRETVKAFSIESVKDELKKYYGTVC